MKLKELTEHIDPLKRMIKMIFGDDQDWTLNDDGSIDLKGTAVIYADKLPYGELPVKIRKVEGSLYVNPDSKSINGNAGHISNLKSLKNFPDEVTKDFICEWTMIENLKGCPQKIGGKLNICNNKYLNSLEGICPVINRDFDIEGTDIENFKFMPKEIRGTLSLFANKKLESFEGINNLEKMDDTLFMDFGTMSKCAISLVAIEGLKYLSDIGRSRGVLDGQGWMIIQKYLGKPEKIFECQQELIEEGYDRYAEF